MKPSLVRWALVAKDNASSRTKLPSDVSYWKRSVISSQPHNPAVELA